MMKTTIKSAVLAMALVVVAGAGALFLSCTSTQSKSPTYRIGDMGPTGGWIFYDKGNSRDGWRYLEVALEDYGEATWGCYKKSIPGAKGTAIGAGKANTAAIINGCEESVIAANVAVGYRGGGRSDWFLPSKDEMNLIYQNLHKNGAGGFADDVLYWSSTEYDESTERAWAQGFGRTLRSTDDKNSYRRVRAVRAF